MLIGRFCEDIDYSKYSEVPIPFKELVKHLLYNPERIITYARDTYYCFLVQKNIKTFENLINRKCHICNKEINWDINPEDDFMVSDIDWWKTGLRSWHMVHFNCYLSAKEMSKIKYPKRQNYIPKYKTNQPTYIKEK